MKTAVAYVRFSSDNQREESIDAQIRAIKKHCEDNEIELIKIYEDHALTGRNDDRPGFLEMISDSMHLEYGYVIVHKFERFARSRYDSAMYKNKLKKNGKKLISVLEPLDNSPESILLESLYEGLAEYYSANLAREVMKGMNENAYNAKFNGGTPPLGYKIDENKNYVIDEIEAAAVRLIFNAYANDEKMVDIMDKLNSLGIKTSKGAKFNSSSCNRILNNEKYVGTYKFGEIVIENAIPPIVSKELFEMVQRKMKNKRLRASKRAKQVYLLSGLLKCKDGKLMIGVSGTSKSGSIYRYYNCNKCGKYINADKIENKVIKAVQNIIFSKENLDVVIDEMYEHSLDTSNLNTIRALKREIENKEKEIENLIDAIAAIGINDRLAEKLKETEYQKEKLERSLQNEKLKHKPMERKEIANFMYKHKNLNEFTKKELKIILKFFIEYITLEDNRLIITLPVKDLSSCNVTSGGPSGTRTQDLPVMSRAL